MAPLVGKEVVRLLGKMILGLDILNAEKGWSQARTALEVLRQIDEFLCNYKGDESDPDHISKVIEYTKNYQCKLTKHTYETPVPWPKCVPKKESPEQGNQTYVNNPSNEWQVAKATSGVGWGKVMYEARLDKVERITNQYQQMSFDAGSNMCSCRFGWATADSEESAISGIFYGNGESSHIIIRAKTKIATFVELGENETFSEGDYICAGVDFEENLAWFARNGEKVGAPEGYPLPPFLRKQMLYPVVGLQNSAVQLNFGEPKSVVPDTEGWMTIEQHKQLTKSDYLWNTRRQLHGGWNQLFVNDYPRGTGAPQNLAAQIFSFLKDSDLLKCKCVCTDWRRLITDSYLLQRSKLQCSILRRSFRDCVLGLGVIIQYTDDGVHVTSVRSEIEYFSWNAWDKRKVRSGSANVEYTHFLPLAIDPEHARQALPVLQQLFPTYLPGQGLQWSPAGVLTLMSSLMNGTIVALANDAAEPTEETTLKQLQLYTHLHHMFLYLNKHFNQQISQIARSEIQATLESDKRLQKDHLYDIGTFMLSIAITPDYQWKNIRKPVLLELFDRDVPKYLARYPELELKNQDVPDMRLRKVMDCIVYERRKTMLQVWFTVNVNFHGASVRLLDMLEGYNIRFGSATKAIQEEIHQSIKKIYEANNWASYFTGLYLKPKDQEFIKNILDESMKRAAEKRYFTPREQDPAPMHADPAYPPQSNLNQPYYPPQPQRVAPAGPRICHKFEDLSPPLAACLEDCEPLPLQEEALPIITRGTESVIISPLGTGKHTLAAVTVVNTLIQSKKGSQVLVLVPEKNQAIHFEEILSDIYVHVPESDMHPHKKIPINVVLSVPKMPYPTPQQLQQRCVMVGTPGRVNDLIEKKCIDPAVLKAVYILEGDSLLSNGSTRGRTFECFKHIFSGIQLVFMASTFTPFVEEAFSVIGDGTAASVNGILNKTLVEDNFTHFFVGCIYEVKKMQIFDLLCREMQFEQGIAYCSNTDKVRKFRDELTSIGGSGEIGMLHKNMDSEERREQVRNFNDKTTRILIIEDRIPLYGVKTQSVSCVIHVDVPRPPRPRQEEVQFQKNDTAMDAYDRRLANFMQSEEATTSICFAYRDRGTEQFLTLLKDTRGIEELPEDPNTV